MVVHEDAARVQRPLNRAQSWYGSRWVGDSVYECREGSHGAGGVRRHETGTARSRHGWAWVRRQGTEGQQGDMGGAACVWVGLAFGWGRTQGWGRTRGWVHLGLPWNWPWPTKCATKCASGSCCRKGSAPADETVLPPAWCALPAVARRRRAACWYYAPAGCLVYLWLGKTTNRFGKANHMVCFAGLESLHPLKSNKPPTTSLPKRKQPPDNVPKYTRARYAPMAMEHIVAPGDFSSTSSSFAAVPSRVHPEP